MTEIRWNEQCRTWEARLEDGTTVLSFSKDLLERYLDKLENEGLPCFPHELDPKSVRSCVDIASEIQRSCDSPEREASG